MTRRRAGGRSHCPISFALDVFGDQWTLLVVRDLLLRGKRTYGELLASEESMATNVLADRLARLEAQGIVTRARQRRRVVYRLTRKGLDLLPLLLDIVAWSAKYDPHTAAPAALVRRLARDRERVEREILAAVPVTRSAAAPDPTSPGAPRGRTASPCDT